MIAGPRPVLLVGSVPLDSEHVVFETASRILGPSLRAFARWRDGRTAELAALAIAPFSAERGRYAQRGRDRTVRRAGAVAPCRGRAGRRHSAGTLGLCADRNRLLCNVHGPAKKRNDSGRCTLSGVAADGDRVSWATSIRQFSPTCCPCSNVRCWKKSGRSLRRSPHQDVALQWDTAVEFAVLELGLPLPFSDARAAIVERTRATWCGGTARRRAGLSLLLRRLRAQALQGAGRHRASHRDRQRTRAAFRREPSTGFTCPFHGPATMTRTSHRFKTSRSSPIRRSISDWFTRPTVCGGWPPPDGGRRPVLLIVRHRD